MLSVRRPMSFWIVPKPEMQTARAPGIEVPPTLFARANEAIE
jgi:hypothetical protein